MKEIERMLRSEIKDKKRTASNVHKKTGKRGYIGSVRYPYQNFTAKEKRAYTKSGEVIKYNMKEIMDFETFYTYSEEQQKEFLMDWRERYSNKEILNKMGIKKKEYYDLLDKLDVPKKGVPKQFINKESVTQEQIDDWKENLIDYQDFKKLVREQQSELFNVYKKEHSIDELAELWNVSKAIIYGIRSNLKKWNEKEKAKQKLEKADKPNKVQINMDEISKNENQEKETSIVKRVAKMNIPKKTDDNLVNDVNVASHNKFQSTSSMVYSLQGEYHAQLLRKRLQKVVQMLSDENTTYEVNIQLKEINNDTINYVPPKQDINLSQNDFPNANEEKKSNNNESNLTQKLIELLITNQQR